jgi:glycylpeptide N-tetradecanoyltransferase
MNQRSTSFGIHNQSRSKVLPLDIDEVVEENGPIEFKTVADIRKEPYTLPKDFEWYLVDLNDQKDLKDTYELLTMNYVEDDDAVFRFDYSAAFLKWALQPPGWSREWHIGVRVVQSKKLVAFISGVPADLLISGQKIRLVEINFLCVHKKLRSKRLAPVMIKEVTRRVNLQGIFQAVYTAGVLLPKPITTCRYYHRSLNPKKLIETGFSYLGRNETMAKVIKKYKLNGAKIPNWRPMEKKDVSQVANLLKEYHKKFECAPVLSEEDVGHYLLPVDHVVYSYVVEEGNTITDFVSFYFLNSSVLGNDKHTHVYAAYLYYYVPKGFGADKDRMDLVIHDGLVFAQEVKLIYVERMRCLQLLEFGRE